ncbi:glycerophosphoryl diester phosphodiesterase [Modicisalibacter muralis]|uniref:Glycerophosphoryl diester phosphodiesterase n=1 Tax=Modicisalibacter muralis TaxID=119000 RepID=A0A1G9MF39_9GAMM|nr:glycerophosphodiester phosphodiesterase family protein [Halomonas muralis]SDL72754.1 glycerophosphoryl diester phosphodiesterase [Halomonas muralis]
MSDAAFPDLPSTIAHRGLSAHAPENTLAAVRAAHAAGCRWVELDVQLLGDGTPVIWHDSGLRRCSSGRGKLQRLSLEAAHRLDVGAWFSGDFVGERMATLDAMLALIDELGMGLNLEIKLCRGRDAKALVDAAVPRAMAALPGERLIVSSFSLAALDAMRRLESDPKRLRLGMLYDKAPRRWLDEAQRLDAYSLHVDWRRLTLNVACAIAASPCKLLCYTVNDPAAFARLREWGMDSAISDDPANLIGVPRLSY